MNRIPKPTIKRLAIYYRCLERLREQGEESISSKRLAQLMQIKDSQVRKDLSYFGTFGRRGIGYNIQYLMDEIQKILGINKKWRVVIIGAGNIGQAIARFKQIEKHNFEIAGVFDVDTKKIGTKITDDLTISSMENLESFIDQNHAEIAVIATPAEVAQAVAERLEKAGIRGIICFAPVTLSCSVPVEYVDITVFFKTLVHYVVSQEYNI
ncbi:redox-sensing transcriptional repressor Rex [Pseudothermotoga sp. U03pept]|uniref:redox-sensing transcriptional repressor Rex n=1 Tax=Pseudothermotoga sp. U03pept TaxID=3447012 RepID=UPI003F10E48F